MHPHHSPYSSPSKVVNPPSSGIAACRRNKRRAIHNYIAAYKKDYWGNINPYIAAYRDWHEYALLRIYQPIEGHES